MFSKKWLGNRFKFCFHKKNFLKKLRVTWHEHADMFVTHFTFLLKNRNPKLNTYTTHNKTTNCYPTKSVTFIITNGNQHRFTKKTV